MGEMFYSKIYSTERSLYFPPPQCKVGAALFLFLLFCSFSCSKKTCQSQQKGVGPGNKAQRVREHVDFRIPNSTPNPPDSSFLSNSFPRSLPGHEPHSQYLFPPRSGARLPFAGWTPLHLSSPLHSCFTHFHIYHQTKWLQIKDSASRAS